MPDAQGDQANKYCCGMECRLRIMPIIPIFHDQKQKHRDDTNHRKEF
uniref:Uncharacterized protein n=2 Tax=Enterobacteriaceae TaxID=543 RepID=A0A3G4RLC5_ECOLX|nr:hypothetical protein [Escherichia coli]AYU66547.1 hypothetical protein [Salmonella enterica subsp. enterica serovar Anatum]AYU66700.1 hypothetical protein [Salmonella enterica subsp. enterica serovar Anatum]